MYAHTHTRASYFSIELSALYLVILSMLTPNWSKPQLEVVWDLISHLEHISRLTESLVREAVMGEVNSAQPSLWWWRAEWINQNTHIYLMNENFEWMNKWTFIEVLLCTRDVPRMFKSVAYFNPHTLWGEDFIFISKANILRVRVEKFLSKITKKC